MLGLHVLLQPRLSARSVAVPFSLYRLSYQGNIVAAVINQPLCLLDMSIQECTDTHMHGQTTTHMTEWLAADIHRQGVEKEANPNLFTSLLNKAALSVRLISNMFGFGAFLFVCLFVLSFYFQILLTSLLPFFLSRVGGTVPGRGKKKKGRKK